MNLKQISRFGFVVLFAAALAVTTGCRSTPKAWNVHFNKVSLASIEVDVIGISPSEKPYWQNIKPDDYWKDGSPLRKDAAGRMVTFNFNTGGTWDLKMDDAMWQTWFSYGSTELMVIARLPGVSFDNSAFDRRRIFLPLAKRDWEAKHRTIQIEVQDEFIRVLTPQKHHNE